MPESYLMRVRGGRPGGGKGALLQREVSGALVANQDQTLFDGTGDDYIVRRLTPRECERLQGFPDDWTLVPYRGRPAEECPDAGRYQTLGNSMAVPVIRWLGERITLLEELEGENDEHQPSEHQRESD